MENTPQTLSVEIARAAIEMSLTMDRDQETALREHYKQMGILTAAVDYGGDFQVLFKKGVERALIAAEREGLIDSIHSEQGAVAGAAKEAFAQLIPKALGAGVGGKIGLARYSDHLSVAVFMSIGLLHFNEVAVAVGHRTLPQKQRS